MNLSWLLPAVSGIPVLMYHRVWPGESDGLTITPANLRMQWSFLKDNGYAPLSLQEYLEVAKGTRKCPPKAFLLTFDDGYRNNLTYVCPLLQEFKWKAVFFIIASTLHEFGEPDQDGVDAKMGLEELQRLDPGVVQLGIHGYAHENFGKISLGEMQVSVTKSLKAFEDSGLPFHKVLAYPYGARPANKSDFAQLKQFMAVAGIVAAFRIGNQVSKMPAQDLFELKRIDIKGTDTLSAFKTKMKKGKLKPF